MVGDFGVEEIFLQAPLPVSSQPEPTCLSTGSALETSHWPFGSCTSLLTSHSSHNVGASAVTALSSLLDLVARTAHKDESG